VIDITTSPIIIVGTSETNYDLAYNEIEFAGLVPPGIYLDSVILGISVSPAGSIYYDVFNWGNGALDFNTNISGVPDADNQQIPLSALWPYPGTGILIDADNAPSQPPPGTYGYLVVICPPIPPATQSLQVDSVLIFP
jgi:hypothetical protein